MATTYLTAGDICVELVQWRMFRRDGMSEADAAALMGLSPSTAADYESAVKAITAPKSETAPDATEAASDPSERNRHA